MLLRGEDKASIYDLTARKIVASCSLPAGVHKRLDALCEARSKPRFGWAPSPT